ncbi:(Fe-S)-binding protein [Methanosarcina hadiensis]|uniref:(Fe-S)-binding protein n=1 Tax=Methanosarcina hadiensis TaxID=3078083 RepID=UPI00397743D3
MSIVQEYREKCTRCGQCLDICPRYEDLDLLDGLCGYLEGSSGIDQEYLLRCLTCGLCISACPEDLGIKPLISSARQKWVNENGLSDRQTMVDPEAENNIFKKIAEMDGAPECPDRFGSVVYFPGCAGTYINRVMAQATVALLDKAGVDYTVLSGLQYCCGAVSAGSGDQGPIRRHGQQNIDEIRRRGAKILVTACPGCFKAFKDIYPRMFGKLDFEVLQVSQYLDRLLEEGKISPEPALNHRKVFYHDPCHLTRSMGVYREARNVLENIPGTELANKTPECSACCGFGGGVRVNYPSESISVASDRFRAAEELGCDVIVTNCGGCMQNLTEAGKNEKIKIFDLAEYLALACGAKIEREDRKMIELVNRAYSSCISGYKEPELQN